MEPQAVLQTFGKLASERTALTNVLSVGATFLWQRYRALDAFAGNEVPVAGMPVATGFENIAGGNAAEKRVLATAELHRNERRLFIGWVWFSGTRTVDGVSTTYCFPAVTIPIEPASGHLETGFQGTMTPMAWESSAVVSPAGDLDLTDLVSGEEDRQRLLDGVNFGDGKIRDLYIDSTNEYTPVDISIFPTLTGLNEWIDDVAKTVGLPVSSVRAAHQGSPVDTVRQEGITVHIGCGLFLEPTAAWGTRRESLMRLAGLDGLEDTSLAHLYGDEQLQPRPVSTVTRFRALSRRQASIAKGAIDTDLTVLSGAPGAGKSHVLTVLAMNAIERGESVLVAAGSPHAVDVLAEHFAKSPGPTPVVFGGSRYGKELARDLAELASDAHEAHAERRDIDEHNRLLASAARLLDVEIEAVRIERDPTRRLDLVDARQRAGDLDELQRLVSRCGRRGPAGWVARKRHAKQVDSRLGHPDDRQRALDALQRGAEAQRLQADGGLTLAQTYDAIIENEAAVAVQRGAELTESWLHRMDADQRAALAQISSALASTRSVRRKIFATMDPDDLTKVAPLWVGSIRDVEDVLPEVAGLFDLLLIDEAAQIDQTNAVNALTRSKRVVICGDPKQLGHVSFMTIDDERLADRQVNVDGDILNLRDQSLFDVGASRVPTMVLDEHFRSAPHIIEFSARRMYNSQLHVVGRNPANEAADHIHVEFVDGSRDDALVNQVEIDACIRVGEEMIEAGHRSIGFLSPFPEQAVALEEAILDRWQLEEIDAFGLRVGTVHGFQGDERDVIIASWTLGPTDDQEAWSYVNQENLFNVMVTRARKEVVIVTSTPDPPGLAGDYVRWSEPLTNLVRDVELDDVWIRRVAETLRSAGMPVRVGYSVGRHIVDLVVGDIDPIAVDCVPHADGPGAHTDRALQLRRMGWRTTDAFESKWSDRLGELTIYMEDV